jgi:hypothetical protein
VTTARERYGSRRDRSERYPIHDYPRKEWSQVIDIGALAGTSSERCGRIFRLVNAGLDDGSRSIALEFETSFLRGWTREIRETGDPDRLAPALGYSMCGIRTAMGRMLSVRS